MSPALPRPHVPLSQRAAAGRTLAVLVALAGLALPMRAPAAAGDEATFSAVHELPARDFAIRAGKVIPIAGPDLEPGIVIIRDRRIVAVGGPELSIPRRLPVLDAGRHVLVPGFVEAHSQRGLDRTAELTADASFVRVSDGVNPASVEIEDARRNGITTLHVLPENRVFLGGRSAILHPQGLAVDSMIVKQDAALKISLLPAPGTSRMGHLARLRRSLDETRRYLDEREERRREGGGDGRRRAGTGDDDIPARRQALVDLLEGRLPAYVYCPTAADVAAAFEIAGQRGVHVVPVLEPETWRAAKLLRVNRVTPVLSPGLDAWEVLPDGTTLHVNLARVLWQAGVPFALTTDPGDVAAQHPWHQAARAVRAGVPRAVALEAITRTPARLLGFGNRKGVLAPGADADLVLLSDDPLSGTAWVESVFIRGERVYHRPADDRLERLLSRLPEPPVAAIELDHDEEDEDPNAHPEDAADDGDSVQDRLAAEERRARWPVPARPRR